MTLRVTARHVAGHLTGFDEAVGGDRGQAVVVGLELGVGRHIGFSSVGISGHDAQLLPVHFREPSVNIGNGQPPHLVGPS